MLFFCALVSTVSFALQESTGPNGSNVQAVHAEGFTGQGVSVGLISQDHSLVAHEAFDGHAYYYNATDQSDYIPSDHDTSVGGIICSRGGALYPDEKGAAPTAELYSVKVTRLEGENYISAIPWMDDALNYLLDQQCKVVVTAIQLSETADGSTDWSLIYDYYAYEYNLIFATAAGNYATNITVFGDTYNSITTGGLIGTATDLYDKIGSGSNPGPTADGRQKPDICAPSQSQTVPTDTSTTAWTTVGSTAGETSWSVPQTGGVAAALLSYADTTTTEPGDNRNEVIKAVIVNSTFPNIQDEYGTATTGQVWNNYRGYGRIDALRAYDILSSPKIIPSSTTGNSKGWAFDSVASGQQDSFTISGIKNERLVVTLTWNRRVVWADQRSGFPARYNGIIDAEELTAYLANLDLEIRDPDGILISPTASTIDNLEKNDLLLTKTGNYEIRIVNQSGSESANYALAFELLEPLPADFNVDYVVNDLDLVDFLPYWLDADCNNPSQPCYPYNLSSNDPIDLSDYSIFAQKWLTYDSRYYSP
ncbi:MAG: S8 family serine peptidase [Planctomycetota bacterium]